MHHQLINSQVSHYSGILYHGEWFPAHFHNSYELIYILEGTISLTVGTKTTDLTAGELLLISPCAVHEVRQNENAVFFIAIIAPDYITDYSEAHKNDIAVRFRMDADTTALIRKKLIDSDAATLYERKACFYLLLSFAEKGTSLLHIDQYDSSFVYEVNSYIAEHFTERVRRHDLAQKMGYEEHYFSSLFSKNFGMKLRKYLNISRISHACQLLSTTDGTVSSIAFASGFSSVRDFNMVFSDLIGMTPTEYRSRSTLV